MSEAAPRQSIGARLQGLRQEHRYSIRGLAQDAGVSASLISDIERDKVEPSISTLKRLATTLGTTLAFFFTEAPDPGGRLVRASERSVLGEGHEPRSKAARRAIETAGIRYEIASPAEAEQIEAIYGHYAPGASLGDPITHEGEEWGMVLSGRLKVWVGEEIYFLDPGDAICFPSTTPHRMENVAEDETEYIWINVPKSF
ncbi:MAG: cupin domain-containing protein [Solirubrobacterales bacterium]